MAGCADIGAGSEVDPYEGSERTPSSETVATASEALVWLPTLASNSPRWSYRGQFQIDDCGVNMVGNRAWQNNALFSCPSASTIWSNRSLMPESKCGGNQYQCVIGGFSVSTSLHLGGMFQVDDCGQNHVYNGITDTLGCPYGYYADAIGRVLTPESKCGAWQYVCDTRPGETSNNPYYDRVRWGGQFQIDDCGTNSKGNALNANLTSCPYPYTAVRYGRVRAPEGNKCGVNQYVCLAIEP
ncbi:MAG: hypothetical protein QM784_37300 [Polyangiaceae bacterium]